MMKAISLFLLFFLFTSCLTDEDVEKTFLRTQSIKTVTVSGKTAEFTVICTIPTPCYEYYNYKETKEDNHYYLKFYAKHDKHKVCPQVVSSLDVTYKKTVAQSGEYIFHFFTSDSTTLDTTIVIR